MTISLAFLAPDLVRAAVEGRLPRGLGVRDCAMRPPSGADSLKPSTESRIIRDSPPKRSFHVLACRKRHGERNFHAETGI